MRREKGLFDENFRKKNFGGKKDEWDLRNLELLHNGSPEDVMEFYKKTNVKKLYRGYYELSWFVNFFTMKSEDARLSFLQLKSMILKKYSSDVNSIGVIFNDNYKTSQLQIKTNKGEIKIIKLTDVIPGLKNIFEFDLETPQRYGKCLRSFEVSKNLGIKHDLVVGYIYGGSDVARYLHSWIETKLHGEEVVIDLTMNAIVNKKGYYQLKNINEKEILQRTSDEQIYEDMGKWIKVFETLELTEDEYMLFRDEIINDLEKNESVLK